MAVTAKLNGPQKAALVILGMDEVIAANILRQLEEPALKRLATCIESFHPIPTQALDPTFDEFNTMMRDHVPLGGAAYMRKLTASALGDEKARRLFSNDPVGPEPLDAIRKARSQTLAELLMDEHPQVAAVILSQLPREQAAAVLLAMPQDRQADLIVRVGGLEEVSLQLVNEASEALLRALEAAGGGVSDQREKRPFEGVTFAAGLMNELPPGDSERVLASLESLSAKLAPKIREAMFTFEDLSRLDTRALQVLMREVAADTLLIALKQASEELRERFFSSVSSRAAAQMREDLSSMPPTRLSDIERAQREIVDAAMRLASEGRLTLPGSSAEEMV